MKFIEKFSLTIFSIIILVLGIVLSLILFNWLNINCIYNIINLLKSTHIITNISLCATIVLMLLAIKCIFFPSYEENNDEKSTGVLLENEVGKLLISKETIESMVKGVIDGFPSVKTSICKVKLNKQINNVIIDLNLTVFADTVIKELSLNIQTKIKEVVKITTEIDVKEINIKIKNIEPQKD